MTHQNPEIKNNLPDVGEKPSIVDENSQLEKKVANNDLRTAEYNPNEYNLISKHPGKFSKKAGETTKANPLLKKDLEHNKIETALVEATKAEEIGKNALATNTQKTQEEIMVIFPDAASTVDLVKADNEKPKESWKDATLDKEIISGNPKKDPKEDLSQYAV
jgi:hypothetical protein